MSELTRRTFLKNTSKAVIVGGMMATSGRVFGANDRVGVAVMGVNGRGKSHIVGFGNKPDSDIVAMVDPDSRVLSRRIETFANGTGDTPASYADIRDALADKNVDAISIATPNHWHSLASIWGVEAGKDVYVEKPLSHNIYEGRQLANLFAKSDRIVQHGTQSRSSGTWLRDIGLIHDGFLGKIHMGKGFTYKTGNRKSIGHSKAQTPPKHLDWTLWQGPAESKQYRKNYVHYNWHWFWDYGNGETGNQGVHQMDLAVWGMNRGLPTKVYSAGDRYHWDDDAETPNTQATTFTYEDGAMMIFEIRNYGSYKEAGVHTTGNTFWGEHGYYVEGKGFFDMEQKAIPIPEGTETPATRGNWQNFIDSCKSRDKSGIFGDAEDGHIASAHCHLANAAYRLGHSLEIDPKKERFIGSEEGNAILTRRYRKGFEVKPA
ncbi:MAG: Gfo/Idh/MocA family oxidoreductase [Candidatus Hydrogenedentota bacterium]